MSKEISGQIHEKAAPFIKWLREAEEESSEEEEDDDVDVVYATAVEKEKIMAQQKLIESKAEEDDGDIDIDDIWFSNFLKN